LSINPAKGIRIFISPTNAVADSGASSLGGSLSTESATALVGEMKILIPLAGLIDKEQEIVRLNKEIVLKINKHSERGWYFVPRVPLLTIIKKDHFYGMK
jgi:hypothetical protein